MNIQRLLFLSFLAFFIFSLINIVESMEDHLQMTTYSKTEAGATSAVGVYDKSDPGPGASTSPEETRPSDLISIMINSAIGCGVLFLPKALYDCNLIPGVSLLVASGVITWIPQLLLSQVYMMEIGHGNGISDYTQLPQIYFQSRPVLKTIAEGIIALVQFLSYFGPMIAYIKLIGQFSEKIVTSIIRSVNRSTSASMNSFSTTQNGSFSNYTTLATTGLANTHNNDLTESNQVPNIFSRPTVFSLCGSLVVFLLSLLTNFSKLGILSWIVVGCIIYIGGLTVIDYAIASNSNDIPPWKWNSFDSEYMPNSPVPSPLSEAKSSVVVFRDFHFVSSLPAFNVFVLAYSNILNLLPSISKIQNPTFRDLVLYTGISQIAIIACYAVVAIFGYLRFGSECNADIPYISFKPYITYKIAQVCAVIIMVLSYPILNIAAKGGLDSLVAIFARYIRKLGCCNAQKNRRGAKDTERGSDQGDQSRALTGDFANVNAASKKKNSFMNSNGYNILRTLGIVVLSYILAIFIPSIDDVFNVFIPVSASFVVFIIPPICYFMSICRKGEGLRKHLCRGDGILAIISNWVLSSLAIVCVFMGIGYLCIWVYLLVY